MKKNSPPFAVLQIHQKSLVCAPPRLQHMLLQLQRYDLTIRYKPGKDMLLTDALSRCPSKGSEQIKLDMRVDYVAFNKARIAKLKETTREDPITGTCEVPSCLTVVALGVP